MRLRLFWLLVTSLVYLGCTKEAATASSSPTPSTKIAATTAPVTSSGPAAGDAPKNDAPKPASCKAPLPASQQVDAATIARAVLPGYSAETDKVATLAAPKDQPDIEYGVLPCRGNPLWVGFHVETFPKGTVKVEFVPGKDWATGMYLAWVKLGELPGLDGWDVGFRALVEAKDGSLSVVTLGEWKTSSGHDVEAFYKVGDHRLVLEKEYDSGEESPTEGTWRIWIAQDGAWLDAGTITRSYEETRNFPLGNLQRTMSAKLEPNATGFKIRETWTFTPEDAKKGPKKSTKVVERQATLNSNKVVLTPAFEAPKP